MTLIVTHCIPAESGSEPPGYAKPKTSLAPTRGLTTWTPDDVLQKSVLRCHKPSLSPGHPAAGGRSWCRSGSVAVCLLLGGRYWRWLSVGPMEKLIVTVRSGCSGRTEPQRRRCTPVPDRSVRTHACNDVLYDTFNVFVMNHFIILLLISVFEPSPEKNNNFIPFVLLNWTLCLRIWHTQCWNWSATTLFIIIIIWDQKYLCKIMMYIFILLTLTTCSAVKGQLINAQ